MSMPEHRNTLSQAKTNGRNIRESANGLLTELAEIDARVARFAPRTGGRLAPSRVSQCALPIELPAAADHVLLVARPSRRHAIVRQTRRRRLSESVEP